MPQKAVRGPTRRATSSLPEYLQFNYLANAATTLSESLPSVSAQLGRCALQFADTEGLNIPRRTMQQFCQRCFLPLNAINCKSVELRPLSKRSSLRSSNKAAGQQQNTVAVIRTCRACNHRSVQQLTSEDVASRIVAEEQALLSAAAEKAVRVAQDSLPSPGDWFREQEQLVAPTSTAIQLVHDSQQTPEKPAMDAPHIGSAEEAFLVAQADEPSETSRPPLATLQTTNTTQHPSSTDHSKASTPSATALSDSVSRAVAEIAEELTAPSHEELSVLYMLLDHASLSQLPRTDYPLDESTATQQTTAADPGPISKSSQSLPFVDMGAAATPAHIVSSGGSGLQMPASCYSLAHPNAESQLAVGGMEAKPVENAGMQSCEAVEATGEPAGGSETQAAVESNGGPEYDVLPFAHASQPDGHDPAAGHPEGSQVPQAAAAITDSEVGVSAAAAVAGYQHLAAPYGPAALSGAAGIQPGHAGEGSHGLVVLPALEDGELVHNQGQSSLSTETASLGALDHRGPASSASSAQLSQLDAPVADPASATVNQADQQATQAADAPSLAADGKQALHKKRRPQHSRYQQLEPSTDLPPASPLRPPPSPLRRSRRLMDAAAKGSSEVSLGAPAAAAPDGMQLLRSQDAGAEEVSRGLSPVTEGSEAPATGSGMEELVSVSVAVVPADAQHPAGAEVAAVLHTTAGGEGVVQLDAPKVPVVEVEACDLVEVEVEAAAETAPTLHAAVDVENAMADAMIVDERELEGSAQSAAAIVVNEVDAEASAQPAEGVVVAQIELESSAQAAEALVVAEVDPAACAAAEAVVVAESELGSTAQAAAAMAAADVDLTVCALAAEAVVVAESELESAAQAAAAMVVAADGSGPSAQAAEAVVVTVADFEFELESNEQAAAAMVAGEVKLGSSVQPAAAVGLEAGTTVNAAEPAETPNQFSAVPATSTIEGSVAGAEQAPQPEENGLPAAHATMAGTVVVGDMAAVDVVVENAVVPQAVEQSMVDVGQAPSASELPSRADAATDVPANPTGAAVLEPTARHQMVANTLADAEPGPAAELLTRDEVVATSAADTGLSVEPVAAPQASMVQEAVAVLPGPTEVVETGAADAAVVQDAGAGEASSAGVTPPAVGLEVSEREGGMGMGEGPSYQVSALPGGIADDMEAAYARPTRADIANAVVGVVAEAVSEIVAEAAAEAVLEMGSGVETEWLGAAFAVAQSSSVAALVAELTVPDVAREALANEALPAVLGAPGDAQAAAAAVSVAQRREMGAASGSVGAPAAELVPAGPLNGAKAATLTPNAAGVKKRRRAIAAELAGRVAQQSPAAAAHSVVPDEPYMDQPQPATGVKGATVPEPVTAGKRQNRGKVPTVHEPAATAGQALVPEPPLVISKRQKLGKVQVEQGAVAPAATRLADDRRLLAAKEAAAMAGMMQDILASGDTAAELLQPTGLPLEARLAHAAGNGHVLAARQTTAMASLVQDAATGDDTATAAMTMKTHNKRQQPARTRLDVRAVQASAMQSEGKAPPRKRSKHQQSKHQQCAGPQGLTAPGVLANAMPLHEEGLGGEVHAAATESPADLLAWAIAGTASTQEPFAPVLDKLARRLLRRARQQQFVLRQHAAMRAVYMRDRVLRHLLF